MILLRQGELADAKGQAGHQIKPLLVPAAFKNII